MRTSLLARVAVVAGLALSTGACSAQDIFDGACGIVGQLGLGYDCNSELPVPTIPTIPGIDLSGGFQLPL